MEKLSNFILQLDIGCDVEGTYEDLRETETVTDSVRLLREQFLEELKDTDDAPVFWLALANVMAKRRELTERIMKKALDELCDPQFKEHYAPIAEFDDADIIEIEQYLKSGIGRAKRRKIKHYECDWVRGDVYAMPLHSEQAKELGLDGRYLVFQTIKTCSFNKDVIPVVYLFLTRDTELPKTLDDVLSCIRIPARMGCIPYAYRYMIGNRSCIDSKEFKSLIYVGRFPDFPAIKETIVRDDSFNAYGRWDRIEWLILSTFSERGLF